MEGHVSPDEGDTVPGGRGGNGGMRGEDGGREWREGGGEREEEKRNNIMTADLEIRTAL